MSEPDDRLRPRSVTVIGWLWLIVGVLVLCRTVVNIVVWEILKPDLLSFLESFGEVPERQQRFLRPLFEHLTTIQAWEAIFSAAVILIAFQLLRLRSWARAAMEAVCWIVLVLVGLFGVFWVWLCGGVAAASPSPSARSLETIGLPLGLAVCLGAAVGLAVTIARLRSSRVRRAFGSSPPAAGT
jgi:hypothetical protein